MNAGTPLEIASIPVRAVAPEENARSSRNRPTELEPAAIVPSWDTVSMFPVATLTRPTMIIVANVTRKKYVGMAKIVPDSRSPRRLPIVSSDTKTTARMTRSSWSSGIADVIAATPAAVLTATVNV